jgi:polar amino acid transport system substrate-binding protein
MKQGRVFALAIAAVCLASAPVTAKQWTTVRIGMDATYTPFEYTDSSGKIVGFEVDYANALCAHMKVTCTYQNQDWDGIIPALLANKFDVILSSMNVTPERQKKLIFSEVYYATPPVFVTQASNKSDDVSPAALAGKTIGAPSSTPHANFLEKLYKNSQIKLYPTSEEMAQDLANGRLDYAVNDQLFMQDFIDKKGNGCCRIVAKIQRLPDIHGPGVGAAFRPGDDDLRKMFNEAIDALDADGTFKTLEAKYFKVDIRGK